MEQVEIQKGRTVILPISLGFDVSQDTFSSEIRVGKTSTSDLIAQWGIVFLTDGTDGELVAILDDAITSEITHSVGYMDLKRVSGGEPLGVFDEPLEVIIKDTVTI